MQFISITNIKSVKNVIWIHQKIFDSNFALLATCIIKKKAKSAIIFVYFTTSSSSL